MWSLDVDPAETRLATGSADAELRIYQINAGGEEDADQAAPGGAEAAAATARGGGPGQPAAAAAAGQQAAAGSGGGGTSSTSSFLTPMGSVRRQSGDRVETVRYDSVPGARGGVLLTCQSAGKVTEVYRVRSQAEAAKKMKRRRKRKREKAEKRAAAEGGAAEEEGAGAEVCALLAGSSLACLARRVMSCTASLSHAPTCCYSLPACDASQASAGLLLPAKRLQPLLHPPISSQAFIKSNSCLLLLLPSPDAGGA